MDNTCSALYHTPRVYKSIIKTPGWGRGRRSANYPDNRQGDRTTNIFIIVPTFHETIRFYTLGQQDAQYVFFSRFICNSYLKRNNI